MAITFIGIDLAWSEKNATGYAVAVGEASSAELMTVTRSIMSFGSVAERVDADSTETTIVAIDAPLVVPNAAGMRACERQLSSVFRSAFAGTHSSNQGTFSNAGPPLLERELASRGFRHGAALDFSGGGRWMIEVYPHPAFVNLFGLKERILYKKGTPEVKRAGLQKVRELLMVLESRDPALVPGRQGRELLESPLHGSPKVIEDQLDAWLCVYIAQHAFRWGATGNVTFGNEKDGYIVVPARSASTVSLPKIGQQVPMKISSAVKSDSKGTTTPGYRNRNGQHVVHRTDLRGNDHGQHVYRLRCEHCSAEYGANGSDIFQRRCPTCQSGAAGLPFS
jgi:predicted RNase H-like nuclease